ncbi:MAG: DUF1127 domain-containing protein [Pseudomonadota bacterium]
MAAFDTNRPFATAQAGGLANIFTRAFDALKSWNEARETRKALRQLNTHQLNDIGITSADIDLFVAKHR